MPVPETATAHVHPDEGARHGRLAARPALTSSTAEPGVHRLTGQALLYVPQTHRPPTRLAVVLHGAGGTAGQALGWLSPHATAATAMLLAPQSIAPTWDMITGGYGPDVTRLDTTLRETFARTTVETVAIAGFSDGASYALSLGVTNGDLFTAVLAFSPGFMAPLVRHGRPRFHISHGTGDRVLPVEHCSRRLVPRLRKSEYPVTYEEFTGGHEVPEQTAAAAMRWWTGG
ncbi:phospholipase [Planomonospora sp. ID91781]|uniref:alpha/beta hydrolase n=1 Tax=Planomonospora sp. ID91781 TaxID=2738135 RepID=UPI0018C35F17|nr:alpha/beta hydrolase-fold protein [Planomonospora sp. ID91781]MBG0823185.1 phospholipase [Planomonospora sp. ID91781]